MIFLLRIYFATPSKSGQFDNVMVPARNFTELSPRRHANVFACELFAQSFDAVAPQ
jgi:hypothetical protein